MMFLRNEVPPEQRFEVAYAKTISHMNRGPLNRKQEFHLVGWATALAHAVYHMHPELREDGSFMRYFVMRQGWRQGLRGKALSVFVDRCFRKGIPADWIPAWFVRGEFKEPWKPQP